MILGLIVFGIFLGFLVKDNINIIKVVSPSINVVIYIMLLLLGVSVGSNKVVINSLSTLGIQALFLAIGGVFGSVVMVYFISKLFIKTQ